MNAENPIPIGTAVSIAAGNWNLAGKVIRCETDRYGYFVDVALEPEWSPLQFLPDHFFDPEMFG